MLRHRDLYPLFDDFADDLENYLTYVRLKTKYDTQNYWMNRIELDCINGDKDARFIVDEMLDYNVKSLAPKIRQYSWYGERLNNGRGKNGKI